jgi:plastocyanin
MNLRRIGVLLVTLGLLTVVGCATHQPFPQSSVTGGLVEVKIGESLRPPVVIAKLGDAVRWINMTSEPVDVSLALTREDMISCQKGFGSTGLGSLFGSLENENIIIARVLPNESANLCFATPGNYVYTLRSNPPIKDHEMQITGSIKVE